MVNLLKTRSTAADMQCKPAGRRTGGAFHTRSSAISSALVSVCLTSLIFLTPAFYGVAPAIAVEAGSPDFPLVVDPLTGRALFGYDPVAYFTAGEARKGRNDLSLRWSGVDFHFSSAENRDHFLAHPNAFVPQLGGHDPGRVQAGYIVYGDPRLFLVQDKKLWLFRDETSKKNFMTRPDIAETSTKRWKTATSK
jgi:YHS domain-containing protein